MQVANRDIQAPCVILPGDREGLAEMKADWIGWACFWVIRLLANVVLGRQPALSVNEARCP